MAGQVLNVGIGVFILSILWAIALTVCLVFARSPTNLSKLGPLTIIVVALISIILIVIPKEDQFPSQESLSEVVDYTIVYRSVLIAVMALFLIVGGVIYLVSHAMTPIVAKPLRQYLR